MSQRVIRGMRNDRRDEQRRQGKCAANNIIMSKTLGEQCEARTVIRLMRQVSVFTLHLDQTRNSSNYKTAGSGVGLQWGRATIAFSFLITTKFTNRIRPAEAHLRARGKISFASLRVIAVITRRNCSSRIVPRVVS